MAEGEEGWRVALVQLVVGEGDATDLDNRTRRSLSVPGRPVPDCPAVPVHGLAGAGRAKVGGGLH